MRPVLIGSIAVARAVRCLGRGPWALFLVTWAVGLLLFAEQAPPALPVPAAGDTAFVCPMHPDYTTDIEGKCPRCGMALVKASPFDVRDYELEFTTMPRLVRAAQRATWRLRVLHPDTRRAITSFEVVHEKQYHLFVISQDLEHFQHIHPELQPDGTWIIDVTVPKPGYYKVLSDFLPRGGAWQFLARPLVTAGYRGDLADDSVPLRPDTRLTKDVDDLRATLSFDPTTFVAGQYGHLNYHLTDVKTGRPVTDLQTYLGAFGHTLIVNEDLTEYVHSHPLDIVPGTDDDSEPQFVIPPGADLEKLRGGPDVTFDGLMPRPGRYRAWTQFRRNNIVHTFSYTFEVKPFDSSMVRLAQGKPFDSSLVRLAQGKPFDSSLVRLAQGKPFDSSLVRLAQGKPFDSSLVRLAQGKP